MNVTAPPRALNVWLDTEHVGRLHEAGGLWAFDYDEAWRTAPHGFDLSPSLARAVGHVVDGGSHRPVQWFFDNLLPEEGARRLTATDAGVDEADAFALLAALGRESAGALTLLAPGEAPPAGGLEPLSDAVLSARIRALPRLPLSHGAPKRMSLAGAQHKLAVVMAGNALYEPVGSTASTHLLKPDHDAAEHYWQTAANEAFVMALAARVGLDVPDVQLRRVPETVYLVRRFDRRGEGAEARRLHALDGCQALGLDRTYKYRLASVETLGRLADACRARAATRTALLRWCVFNLFVGNGDAHLKNLSFFPGDGGLVLAPHYDLLSTAVYHRDGWGAETPLPVLDGAACLGDVRRPHVLAVGEALGLPPPVATRQLDALAAALARQARDLLARFEAEARGPAAAGEARLLRQIVHGPLADMQRQLAAPGTTA